MSSDFKIYLSHLREGKRECVEGIFASKFMNLEEKDLNFPWPIEVRAETYVADESLMLHLSVNARAQLRCSICNELTSINLSVENFLHEEKIEDIKSGVFDFGKILREAILLEVPYVTECNGNCPEREFIQAFLKN